jgi:hypothetical protein
MIQGSDSEDNIPRFFRHFHDPLFNVGFVGFDSAINWALRPIGGQGEDAFSWNDAREYYFKALTSENKADRDENWGKTFRALGQVMHLLQDSANPSHVRDDPHPFDDGLHDFMERRSVGSYVGGGIFSPDPSMLEQSGATRSEPFSNLFDRNVYSGANPQATLGTDIGVTEYTNANFFSDDTIPGQGSAFSTEITHPTVTELVPAPVPSPYLTLPRLGSAAFPGARAAKLTGNQAVAKFLLTNTNLDLLGQLQLDDAVYDAQAQNLIPRAVGYSAAVLDYFFRGEIDLIRHEQEYIVDVFVPGVGCGSVPFEDEYTLNVRFIIPSELDFVGDLFFYYERSDKTRVLSEPRTNILTGQELSHFEFIPHAEIPDPVEWGFVLKGQAGPGAQEEGAIVAKMGRTDWLITCGFS